MNKDFMADLLADDFKSTFFGTQSVFGDEVKQSVLTYDSLIEMVNKIKMADPIAEYMRGKGYDPDKGYIMFVPTGTFDWGHYGPPPYVRETNFVNDIYFMMITKDYNLGGFYYV